MDRREGHPGGDRFPKRLEKAIDAAPVVVLIIGPHGMGRWQEQECYAALQRSIEERDEEDRPNLRLIPILLPGVRRKPRLPTFMRGLAYIDLRRRGLDDREQIRKLVAAILGEQREVSQEIELVRRGRLLSELSHSLILS